MVAIPTRFVSWQAQGCGFSDKPVALGDLHELGVYRDRYEQVTSFKYRSKQICISAFYFTEVCQALLTVFGNEQINPDKSNKSAVFFSVVSCDHLNHKRMPNS